MVLANLHFSGAGLKPSVFVFQRINWLIGLALRGALFCVIAHTRLCLALGPEKSLHQFNCQAWSRQDGLPGSAVTDITQTRDGYIWLATSKGLVRFGGIAFEHFSLSNLPQLPQRDVRCLARKPEGGFFFGLNSRGLGSYDNDVFSLLQAKDLGGQDLPVGVGSICLAGDSSLWLSSGSKVLHLVPNKTADVFPADSDFSFVAQGLSGRIWIGTTASGLFWWENGKLNEFPDPTLKQSVLKSIAEDREGHVWVGTSRGVRCYDSRFKPCGAAELGVDPVGYETRALLLDREGALWIGTTGAGLWRYKDRSLSAITKTDGLPHETVNAIYEDQEGSLWIGTQGGLAQLSDVKFPIFSTTEGLREERCLDVCASSNGGLWVATAAGVDYYDGKFTRQDSWGSFYAERFIESRSNSVWLLESNQRSLVTVSGQTARQVYQSDQWPTVLGEDNQGVLAGFGGELFRVVNNTVTPYVLGDGKRVETGWLFSLKTSSDGSLWITSANGLLQVRNGELRSWNGEPGSPGGMAHGVVEDEDGSLWILFDSALARLKNGKFSAITRENGLFDNNIFALVPDLLGNFWCDCSRGIFRVHRDELNDFCDAKVKHVNCAGFEDQSDYKTAELIESSHCGSARTPDGRIWFTTAKGLLMIDPAHVAANAVPPPVQVKRTMVNGIDFGRRQPSDLKPGRGELSFEYAALSFISPQRIQFKYCLRGYDQDWVEAGERCSAFYTNLKPGRYTFQVVARNVDGVWNKTGASVELELPPHFYQTIWFSGLCALAGLGVILGIFAWRVRALHEKHDQLLAANDLLEGKVMERTAALTSANHELKDEIDHHKRTGLKLAEKTAALESEIQERKRMEVEVERTHKELLRASHEAGMADVATSVLHNVGNVLNSVYVSVSMLRENVSRSKGANLSKLADLIKSGVDEPGFLLSDRGKQIPPYLKGLDDRWASDNAANLKELNSLRKNIDHIKQIVAMQQSYSRLTGVTEVVQASEMVEDAVRMNTGSLLRHQVQLVRDYQADPSIVVQKHKVLQILVNLVRNAKNACDDSGRTDKQITVAITPGDAQRVNIKVMDNGVGIAAENIVQVFTFGFTTRATGHGYGLHSSINAARELGGDLIAQSEGPGKGATFILELPMAPASPQAPAVEKRWNGS